ncbi:hypothetical protein TrCOL_g9298 [Triparma columacea]|uniref:Uncharacterized protein n=1 Tax=Triparma columacea TaxID=722753 RepID=A0A9W7GKA7_9STRA|nr:hypothetical protein TrCOL_g9298 [Triparma columacea]
MRVGGRRRVIVPPKLGYALGGGPVPRGARERRKLNKLIDKMNDEGGGRFVFDVELLGVNEDEGDVGLYDDDVVGVEDFEKLKENVRRMSTKGQTGEEELLEDMKGEKGVLEPDRR